MEAAQGARAGAGGAGQHVLPCRSAGLLCRALVASSPASLAALAHLRGLSGRNVPHPYCLLCSTASLSCRCTRRGAAT